MVDVEKLICVVKNYPILDNKDYKNVKKKDKVWDEIGLELKESGDELKKKWRNLRDCYAKYVRSEKPKTGQAATSTRYYKSWPWAKQMEVFKPYLKFAQTETNVQLNFNESSESTNILHSPENEISCEQQPCEQQPCEQQPCEQQPQQQNDTLQHTVPIRKRKRETESSVDKILTYLQEKRKTPEVHTSNLTATEHMFLGFAKTVATFSARRQASVKNKITNIVLEEELLQKEEEQYALQSTSTSLGGSSSYPNTSNECPSSVGSPTTSQFYESFHSYNNNV